MGSYIPSSFLSNRSNNIRLYCKIFYLFLNGDKVSPFESCSSNVAPNKIQ